MSPLLPKLVVILVAIVLPAFADATINSSLTSLKNESGSNNQTAAAGDPRRHHDVKDVEGEDGGGCQYYDTPHECTEFSYSGDENPCGWCGAQCIDAYVAVCSLSCTLYMNQTFCNNSATPTASTGGPTYCTWANGLCYDSPPPATEDGGGGSNGILVGAVVAAVVVIVIIGASLAFFKNRRNQNNNEVERDAVDDDGNATTASLDTHLVDEHEQRAEEQHHRTNSAASSKRQEDAKKGSKKPSSDEQHATSTYEPPPTATTPPEERNDETSAEEPKSRMFIAESIADADDRLESLEVIAQRIQEVFVTANDVASEQGVDVGKVVLTGAKSLLQKAEELTPIPLKAVVSLAHGIISMMHRVAANRDACQALMERITRLQPSILRLADNPAANVRPTAEKLCQVLKDAQTLIESFTVPEAAHVPPDASRATKLKAFATEKLKKAKNLAQAVVSSTEKFQDVHDQLTQAMNDAQFSILVAPSPSPTELRQSLATGFDELKSALIEETRNANHETQKVVQQEAAMMSKLVESLFAQQEEQMREMKEAMQHVRYSMAMMRTTSSNNSTTAPSLSAKQLVFDDKTSIGKGAFGVVRVGELKLGEDQDLMPVAIKFLSATQSARKEVDRVFRFTQNHKNIVRVFGVCQEHNAIVMERLYHSLDKVIHRTTNTLGDERKLMVATDICRAMAYLHGLSPCVIHHDLKPDNVLLTEDMKTAKLIDFGTAKLRATQGFVTQSLASATGTVAYAAPELLSQGSPTSGSQSFASASFSSPTGDQSPTSSHDAKVDVFSFGVLLYELFTENVPWRGMPDSIILANTTASKRPSDYDELLNQWKLSPFLASIICACWEQDPHRRPSFSMLLDEFRQAQHFALKMEYPIPPFLQRMRGRSVGPNAAGRQPTKQDFEKMDPAALQAYLIKENTSQGIVDFITKKRYAGRIFLVQPFVDALAKEAEKEDGAFDTVDLFAFLEMRAAILGAGQ